MFISWEVIFIQLLNWWAVTASHNLEVLHILISLEEFRSFTFLRHFIASHSRAHLKNCDSETIVPLLRNKYAISQIELEELAGIHEESREPEASNHLDPRHPGYELSQDPVAVWAMILAGSICSAPSPAYPGCRETWFVPAVPSSNNRALSGKRQVGIHPAGGAWCLVIWVLQPSLCVVKIYLILYNRINNSINRAIGSTFLTSSLLWP